MSGSFTWADGSAGGTPLSAANFNKLAVTADIGVAGTPTGDAGRAVYVSDRDVKIAPSPTGGDDSAALAAAMVDGRDVYLSAGATYRIDQRDAIASTGFTGRVIGHGATLRFAYSGVFADTYSAISGLTGATFRDLYITAPDNNLFSVFRNCTDLHLENITVYGCTPKLTAVMPNGFTGKGIRWKTIGSNPTQVDGSLAVPNAGRFVLEDFDYDTIFNGATGAIVSAVATTASAGSTVHIANGRFLTSNLSGYSCDGAIDIEPIGTVGFDSVTIRDVDAFNTSFYLTGARRIDVDNCAWTYTGNNTSGRAIPIVVYNNNTTKPPLGVLTVQSSRAEWLATNPAGQKIGIYSHQGQADAVVVFRNNRWRFNPAAGQTIQQLYWIQDNPPAVFRIDGDTVRNLGATLAASQPLIGTDSTPDRLMVRNMSVEGTLSRKLVATPYGGGGNGTLVAWDGNDFSKATFSNADYVDASITIAKTHTANNAGIEY